MRIAVLLLALALPAQARMSAWCMASFDDGGGWTRERRVQVEFYATRELYPDEDRNYPIFATIWYPGGAEEGVRVTLDGSSYVAPEYRVSSFARTFADTPTAYATERPPYNARWRIRSRNGSVWVDPRFPDDFDDPIRYRSPKQQ